MFNYQAVLVSRCLQAIPTPAWKSWDTRSRKSWVSWRSIARISHNSWTCSTPSSKWRSLICRWSGTRVLSWLISCSTGLTLPLSLIDLKRKGESPAVMCCSAVGKCSCQYCRNFCNNINRSKTHKRLKKRFLIGRNRTKHAHFRGSPFFQAMYNIKTEKQAIQLILCQLYVGGWQKEKGMRLTYLVWL